MKGPISKIHEIIESYHEMDFEDFESFCEYYELNFNSCNSWINRRMLANFIEEITNALKNTQNNDLYFNSNI
jgi:hypothetical protein